MTDYESIRSALAEYLSGDELDSATLQVAIVMSQVLVRSLQEARMRIRMLEEMTRERPAAELRIASPPVDRRPLRIVK